MFDIVGWNGGKCPVHPNTVVRYWLRDVLGGESKAGSLLWGYFSGGCDIVCYQVIKEHVEPKVIWVNEYAQNLGVTHYTKEDATRNAHVDVIRIAVRYVEQPL